jgi:hypothetical protein
VVRCAWRRRIASVMVVLGVSIAPATSEASSLVFSRPDGNVWLANPNGTGLYQVTLDGSPGDPYGAPSQADDGTIVTTRGSGGNELIYRLAQNGAVLSAFKPAVEFSLGLFDAEVSRDGSKVAYWTGFVGNSMCGTEVPAGTPGLRFCFSAQITASTAALDLGGLAFRSSASWMSANRLLTGGQNAFLSVYDLGDPADVIWMNTDNAYDAELTADGKRLASTTGSGEETLTLYSTSGNPQIDEPAPAAPAATCNLVGPAGGRFDDPTWAPDGSGLAWEEGDGDSHTPPGAGEGIWVWNLGNSGNLANDCLTAIPTAPVIAGASRPDWGPVNISPGPRPLPSGSGGGGAGGGGPGGGADLTKPVFQGAIAFSTSTFAAAPRGASVAQRGVPVGATVSYRLSEAATVTFIVERQSAGRRVGRRCVKPTRTNRRRPRCTRYVRVRGSFVHRGKAGRNSFKFTGRLAGRKLSPARYRLVGIAKDAAGNVSAPERATFRIVARRVRASARPRAELPPGPAR